MSVSMSGFLDKAGEKGLGAKRCQTRWFEVSGTNMPYSRAKGETPIGTIDLSIATDVLPTTRIQGKNSYGFEIRTPDRIWFLYAETQAEQETWISHLRDVLTTHRYSSAPAPPAVPSYESQQPPRVPPSTSNAAPSWDSEPPQVPQKPKGPPVPAKVPPKVPPKKMMQGGSHTLGSGGNNNGGPPLPPKKTGAGPPMPRPYGSPSAAGGADSNGPAYNQPNNANPFLSQSSPSLVKGPGKGPGNAGPGVKKAPVAPPRPNGAPQFGHNASASDDVNGVAPGFSKRRNSAHRATTGDLQATGGPGNPAWRQTMTQSSSALATTGGGAGYGSAPSTPGPPSPAGAGASAGPASTNTDKRTKTAKELLQTEKYYCECLVSLRDDFQAPLMAGAKAGGEGYTEADVTTMFTSTLQMIIPVNTELLQGLEKRMADFDPMKTLIGDVFVAIGPFLKMYLDYSRNYQAAIDTYTRLMKDSSAFAARLQASKDRSAAKLGLEHLLIMPVQRIPRYSLLLGELKRETGADHPDRVQLEKAIGLVESVANHINEQMKRLEVGSKALAYPELVAPHRYLMWEGTIETRVDKEKEDMKIVLFNDMLLHHPAKKATKGSKWHLQPESVCSIQLVWTAAATFVAKESSATIGPVEVIDLIVPAKRMTLVASTVEERNLLKSLREAITRHHGVEHPPADREAEHVFSEEATYRGSWRDGKQHGAGTMEYKGIATYTGGWLAGLKQGQGSMAWISGSTYDGWWMAGVPHGEGIFTWTNRDCYSGSFTEGMKSGHGTFKWASGATYVGDWIKDKPGGTGTYDSAYEYYEGTWLDGFFNGQGIFKEKLTGRTYEGNWAGGMREGSGTCRYADGSDYSGTWKKGKRDGKGTLTARLGGGSETYTGDWTDDRKNGTGVLTTADGAVYEGTFKDDLRHGKGKLKFADNDPGIRLRYEGEFDGDRISGKGTIWYQNGDMYDGSFKDNAFNGQGTFQYASSIKVEGKWVMGQLEGKGSIYQLLSPTDKKPSHITGAFSHGTFARSKDAATKFDIPIAPSSATINTTRL